MSARSNAQEGVVFSEAELILAELRTLRQRVIDAWEERGVILTREEQGRLREEIEDTCRLLTELTGN